MTQNDDPNAEARQPGTGGAAATPTADHIELITNVPGADALLVTRVSGRDAISEPFEVTLELEYPDDAGLDPATVVELLTQPFGVRMATHGGALAIYGQLRAFEMNEVVPSHGVRYRAELGPAVLSLADTHRSRIFQGLDLPALIRAVLTEAGFTEGEDFALDLTAAYPPQDDQIVQYDESDWDFLNRWLEHWGLHYHFVHDDAAARSVLVIGDSNRAFPTLALASSGATVPFDPSAGDHQREGIYALRQRTEPRASQVVLRDFNWRKPAVGLQSLAPADEVSGSGFRYCYGEHFKDPEEGHRLAGLRAERLMCERETFLARGSLPGAWAGTGFTLAQHPLPELTDVELRVVGSEWETALRTDTGRSDPLTLVHGQVHLLRASAAYRPPLRTPRPRVDGVMHGRIDGPMLGTAAPIDDKGRYKVLFPFDLIGNAGGNASRWIRIAQPASGTGYGMHFPLHVGAEVMVAHLGGDPDRPVILGSPHNEQTVNPVTKKNATQSQIRTQAGVRILIDDDC